MQPADDTLLARRYHYACGYCGVTEGTSGGKLTIDHYRPRTAGGDDSIDNLVYACFKCNQFKHNFWPSTADMALDWRVLHPLLDDLSTHLRLNSSNGQLESLTETGRFHIILLHLNRPQLIRHRLGLQLQKALLIQNQLLAEQITELSKTIAAQQRYISLLEALLAQPH